MTADTSREQKTSTLGALAVYLERRSLVMLALGFLLMIGGTLIGEGFGAHIPKGYIYAAMAFSALIEGLNMMARKRGAKAVPKPAAGDKS